jgi:uncharacterized membrane protein
MVKEDKVLQINKSELRMAKNFWSPVLRQSWHKTLSSWLWIFVVPLAVDLVWAILFFIKYGWGALMVQIGDFYGLWCLSFVLVLFFIYAYFVIMSSAALYFMQKKIADRFNWNDVNVSNPKYIGGMGEKEFKGYRIKIENNKLERCYFLVKMNYLEVDDDRKDYRENDKSRQLLWVSDDDNNRSFGVGLEARDQNIPKSAGLWELFEVNGNSDNKQFRIVFCGYNKNDRIKPSKQYIYFSRFAKGELKLLGEFADPSGLSSLDRKWREQEIPGDYIYKFEIDVIDGNATMTIFEKGIFEYHPDSEIQEATDER